MESGPIALRQIENRLSQAERRILITDYDGTIAPFVTDRFNARPYPGVMAKLLGINDSGDRVVFVTGRSLKDLLNLFPEARRFEVWGSHGWERFGPEAGIFRFDIEPAVDLKLEQALNWARSIGCGDRCDAKAGAVAIHFRGLDRSAAAQLSERVRARWGKLLSDGNLMLRPFDGGYELLATGRNKGDAVRTVLNEEVRKFCAVYLGDDITDEDAFRAIAGRGMGVLMRPFPRDSAAEYHLKPPEELIQLLDLWQAIVKSVGKRVNF